MHSQNQLHLLLSRPSSILLGAPTPWSMAVRHRCDPAACRLHTAEHSVGGAALQGAGLHGGLTFHLGRRFRRSCGALPWCAAPSRRCCRGCCCRSRRHPPPCCGPPPPLPHGCRPLLLRQCDTVRSSPHSPADNTPLLLAAASGGVLVCQQQWCPAVANIAALKRGGQLRQWAEGPFADGAVQVKARYVKGSRVVRAARRADDAAASKRLWDVSCELTGVANSAAGNGEHTTADGQGHPQAA